MYLSKGLHTASQARGHSDGQLRILPYGFGRGSQIQPEILKERYQHGLRQGLLATSDLTMTDCTQPEQQKTRTLEKQKNTCKQRTGAKH